MQQQVEDKDNEIKTLKENFQATIEAKDDEIMKKLEDAEHQMSAKDETLNCSVRELSTLTQEKVQFKAEI